MEEPGQSPARRTWKYVWLLTGFGIIAIGALLLSRSVRSDYDAYYAPAFVVLVVAFALLLLRMRLHDLRDEQKLHGFLLSVAAWGLVGGLARSYISRKHRSRGPLLRLSIVAGMIALLIIVLDANDVLFERNLEILDGVPWLNPEWRTDDSYHVPRFGAAGWNETPVRELLISTSGRGTEERLELMLKVTKDLVGAGAKVIAFELPREVVHPYYGRLIAQIQDAGPVVFAVQNDAFLWQPLSWDTREMYGPWSPPLPVVRHWGLFTAEAGHRPFADRPVYSVPFGYHWNKIGGGGVDTVADIALEILRRWSGYPDSLRPARMPREVVFGGYRIPVSRTGLALSPYSSYAPQPGFLPVAGFDFPDSIGFKYSWGNWDAGHMGDDLNRFADKISGTIVLVFWRDPVGGTEFPFAGGWWTTTQVLRAALQGQFYTVRDGLQIPATLIVALLGLLATMRLRPWKAALLLMLLDGVILLGSAWLYWRAMVIVEVIYPLMCAALCAILLPLARIAREAEDPPDQSNSTRLAD